MDSESKLTVLMPLKVSESMARALKRYAGSRRQRSNFIRESIAARIAQRKAELMPKVSAAEARALAELRALHIDPLPHLEAIIKDAVENPLPVESLQVGLPATL